MDGKRIEKLVKYGEYTEIKGINEVEAQETNFTMLIDVQGDCDKNTFMDGSYANKEGADQITNMLVRALAGNIAYCNDNGFKDGPTHMKEVIDELNSLFVDTSLKITKT